jgi:hypothetical protein
MRTLSDQIKSKLNGISDIQVVYDYPWLDFDGYPAATITPSGMDSDYETTVENLRKYVFVVRLFVSLNEIVGDSYKKKVEDGFRLAEELVDTVIDTIDKDETLSGISLPSGYTMIGLTPIPSVINYFVEEKMVVAEVKIEAKVSFDTTS